MNYIYGDGASGPFFILENSKIKINRIRGTSIEDITSTNNKLLKLLKKDIQTEFKYLIFILGQIDLFYNYYYYKIKNKKFNYKKIINNYINLLNSLKIDNTKIIIFAVIPNNIINDNNFTNKIKKKYKINNLFIQQNIKYFKYKFRENLRLKFNKYLKKKCKINNINFINCDNLILNKNNKIKNKYINPDKNSFHIIQDYQLEIMTKKLKKHGFNKYKANIENIKKYYKIK
jgi:hypothetical protein